MCLDQWVCVCVVLCLVCAVWYSRINCTCREVSDEDIIMETVVISVVERIVLCVSRSVCVVLCCVVSVQLGLAGLIALCWRYR